MYVRRSVDEFLSSCSGERFCSVVANTEKKVNKYLVV